MYWKGEIFNQGLPSVGTNASVGSLDFLRNSQQVHKMFYWSIISWKRTRTFWFTFCPFQFQALRAMVQANPQILQVWHVGQWYFLSEVFLLLTIWFTISFLHLQPMLQELGKQNPNLMRLIQEHQADFLRLINEPVEGGEGWDYFINNVFFLIWFAVGDSFNSVTIFPLFHVSTLSPEYLN